MSWYQFPYVVVVVAILWLIGCFLMLFRTKSAMFQKIGILLNYLGLGVLLAFVLLYWLDVERPPFRTIGETRLWYSVFLAIIGVGLYGFLKNKGLLIFNLVLAVVFLLINVLKPEIHDKTLMPALQSIWFIPHVTVYMVSYALFGTAVVLHLIGFFRNGRSFVGLNVNQVDVVVKVGYLFLTIGIIFGAFWANEAWGNYWAWDPKETWALLTWLGFISYFHLRKFHPDKIRLTFVVLLVAFVVLHICWFGVKLLPSAAESVHLYSGN